MRLIIFQEKIPHYRVDFFNEIAKNSDVDLTLVHTENFVADSQVNFNTIKLSVLKIGVFRYPKSIFKELKKADSIVMLFDLRWLIIYQLAFSTIRNKAYLWGIGISSSNGLVKKKNIDKFRFWLVSRFKGVILYSNKVADYYISSGVDKKKVLVANNTIRIDKNNDYQRDPQHLLFIGTINERKKLDELIVAFSDIISEIDKEVCLNIIGDGEYKGYCQKLVDQLGLKSRVIFHGSIQSQYILKDFFKRSIIAVSLGQAGLSVLHSFAFGVPYMCYDTAINGGEVENIIHKKTGLLTTPNNLKNDLLEAINSKSLINEMSINCYNYYWKYRTIENYSKQYLKGLIDE